MAHSFLLEVVIIAIVLFNIKLIKDVPYTGPRQVDLVGAVLSVLGMGGIVLGILVWQEGGEAVGAFLVVGAISLGGLVYWLLRQKRRGKPTLIDPDLFKSAIFRFGVSGQMLQQIALGGTMIALPIYLQMVLEYNAMQAASHSPRSRSACSQPPWWQPSGPGTAAPAASSGSGSRSSPWGCWC